MSAHVKGTLVNSNSGLRIPGTLTDADGNKWITVRIDGARTSNTFLPDDGWTFEPEPKQVPTKHGIWLYYSYGLDEDGDLSQFPNLVLHVTEGWFGIGNYSADRIRMSDADVEELFRDGKPVALTIKEEVSS